MTEYERGDVIEAGDPFTQEPASRPFVIINTESHPFDGEQYVALTLTTRTWYEETLPVSPDDFGAGGVPAESSIVPWGVSSPAHDDIRDWFGRLEDEVVNEAVEQFVGYLME
ncbi:type II toxin-antitoxin system PemK/MazF family toxin [Natronomonas gomsonensis]|uniref:type II toxin-antitoxin system PemK/MazF family toxin n=1 Tax=Natronomonas gomsonensis TaxID=1046043 RepID=UPI0020CA846D|nr:type II toxin-antitoxin system PemK/MazF family toxin [Natronomonas gomsonensis]MCY4732100.1 type II toxin-antitoxin system PemK/MazF family toxin [Natronomonas gomsonensis]